MSRERCPVCDAPLATEVDHEAFRASTLPDVARGFLAMCWSTVFGSHCIRTPVDWRARALAAEARVEELDRMRVDALTPRVRERGTEERPCEYCGNATTGSTVDSKGFMRCNACGEPSP